MNFESLSVEQTFTSSGCNRTPNSVNWGLCDYILYAARNSIAIVDPGRKDEPKPHIVVTAAVHSDYINCVSWIKSAVHSKECDLLFVTGGVDKTLSISRFKPSNCKKKVETVRSFTEATSSVVCCDGMRKEDGTLLIAAAAGDSYVRLYKLSEDLNDGACIQSIKFGSGFVLSLHMSTLPDSGEIILACGGDDMKVHLFANQSEKFSPVLTLPGHEDWIRGLEFALADDGNLLLASCAQDCFIRVWRISLKAGEHDGPSSHPDQLELRLKDKKFSIIHGETSFTYSVVVETILSGHEGWVYGVHWQPAVIGPEAKVTQPIRLLTASMDKTMIVWQPDYDSGVWEEKVRVGEVGGNTLGLYGCQFSPDGRTILAHGYQGAFTLWNIDSDANDSAVVWKRAVVVGGHFGEVTDLAWDPRGEFVVSTSLDQTTRLFAPWQVLDFHGNCIIEEDSIAPALREALRLYSLEPPLH